MDHEYYFPLTPEQFETVLRAAYLAESMDLVQFDADLRRVLNALPKEEDAS